MYEISVILIPLFVFVALGVGLIVAHVVETIASRRLGDAESRMALVRTGGFGGAFVGGFVGGLLQGAFEWIPVQPNGGYSLGGIFGLFVSSFVGMVVCSIALAAIGAYLGRRHDSSV